MYYCNSTEKCNAGKSQTIGESHLTQTLKLSFLYFLILITKFIQKTRIKKNVDGFKRKSTVEKSVTHLISYLGYVRTILDSFCPGTKTIPDRASVHT